METFYKLICVIIRKGKERIMALTESANVALGTEIPRFVLKDPDGVIQVSDYAFGKKGLLVAFMCNHCPYAKAVWPRLIRLAKYATELGINVVAINPNIHPNYPEDAPEEMLKRIKELGIEFPYLIDSTQNVARAFDAQCTPDFYLYNSDKKLVYHGRFDDNWQNESEVTKEELKEAITNLANGKPISSEQYPSMGCSIKWRENK